MINFVHDTLAYLQLCPLAICMGRPPPPTQYTMYSKYTGVVAPIENAMSLYTTQEGVASRSLAPRIYHVILLNLISIFVLYTPALKCYFSI